jgi:hypothetical protein
LANQALEKEKPKIEIDEAAIEAYVAVEEALEPFDFEIELPKEEKVDFNDLKWQELKKLGKKWEIQKLHTLNKIKLVKALQDKSEELGFEQATREINELKEAAYKLL